LVLPTNARTDTPVALLFGSVGVAESCDANECDDGVSALMQYVRQKNMDAVSYLNDRIVTEDHHQLLRKVGRTMDRKIPVDNNNCESACVQFFSHVCI